MRFPLNLKNPRIFYETPHLVVERPEEHFAAQNWVSCQGKDYGIALINTGNPGYWVEDKNLDLVLLWSVNQVRPPKSYNAPLAKEIGKHIFKYSLCPYSGSWQENKIVRKGIEANNPLLVTNKKRNDEEILPFKKSFLKVEPSSFIIITSKLAEDKENWIIRGYESEGKESKVSLIFGFPIKRAWLSDFKEKKEKELQIKENKIFFEVKKFEIATISLGGKR